MTEELKVIISAETKKLQDNVNKAKKEISSFKDQVKKAGENVDESFKAAGESIKTGLAVGTAAIAAAGTALLALAGSTAEYRNAQGQLAAAFENAGSTAETAQQTYNTLFRTLGDGGKATEAATHLAKLTQNQEDLSTWTAICQGAYATFGDSLPIEGLTEASNETAKTGQLTGVLADALNWAGVSEDKFQESLDKCNTEAEREKLIREQLLDLYSSAAVEYEKNNSEILAQNAAQAKLDETLAKVGEALAPVITALTELANDVLATLTPHIQKFAENYLPVIKDILGEVATKLGEALEFLGEHKTILGVMAGIIGGITAAITLYNIVAAIKAAMDAAQVTTLGALVAVQLASAAATMVALAPYILIVAAIAAVIAIIVLCIKHWDEIKEVIMKVMKKIVDAVKSAWDWLVNLFTSIINWIDEKLIQPIKNFFKGLWDGIVNGFNMVIMPWIEIIKRAATIIYDTVIKPIKEKFDAMVKWFKESIIQPIGNFFKNMWNGLKDGAKAAWDGITSVFSKVTSWFKDKFTQAWTAVKNVFSIGGKIFDGIKDGIVSVFKTVVNGIIGGINKVITVPFNAINNILKKIKGIEILGVKPFNWVKTFSVPQIPKLAKGGVVDSATIAMIGEQGKEMVMPLENNLEYLEKLATMITNRMGGDTPVILNVDGKVFAQTAINTINANTKQTGSLQLNIL